jgi:hypothetical protein
MEPLGKARFGRKTGKPPTQADPVGDGPQGIRPGWKQAGWMLLGIFLLLLMLALGCSTQAFGSRASAAESAPDGTQTATRTPFQPQSPTPTSIPSTPTPSPTASPTLTPTRMPMEWFDYPVVPEVSDRAREIFALGQSLGNDRNAFSVIGDCEGTPPRFLGIFDLSTAYFRLGEYAYLQEAIDHFSGFFGRISRAGHYGFTTSAVLSPLWAHPAYCYSGETPLLCELRINKPSYALVVVGTMDYVNPPRFEPQMRTIINTLIGHGTIPILYTKASNWEGNWSINAVIGRLAYEYDVPLWNFWRAVQPLPWHGLRSDGMHLTWWYNYFDDPYAMTFGWPWRNLTALMALDSVWRGVDGPAPLDFSGPPDIAAGGW